MIVDRQIVKKLGGYGRSGKINPGVRKTFTE
jgi:hypothetical protein